MLIKGFKFLMKRVKLCTLGCKINQYETQGLREQLLNAGFKENNSEKADIYVINTCTVTHQADAECRRLIRSAARFSAQGQIVLTGCYVEKDADAILRISDRIKIVPRRLKHRFLELLQAGLG